MCRCTRWAAGLENLWTGESLPLLGTRVLQHVLDRVVARVDLLSVGIGDLNHELVLEGHDHLRRASSGGTP